MAAVTATATPEVMREIKQLLVLQQPQVLSGSFNRHNIQYTVRHKELIGDGSDDAVLQVLLIFLTLTGSCLRTRKCFAVAIQAARHQSTL